MLFGSDGQVGWELQRSLAPLGDVKCFGKDFPLRIDFQQTTELKAAVTRYMPDVIVNAAAFTNVEAAESARDAAFAINATAPGELANLAASMGACFVHYSTDYVFNGQGHVPWSEQDITDPLNIYGSSKLEGEYLIQQAKGQHLILRTSWVHSPRGNNFVRTMLELSQSRKTLPVVSDQIGAPTSAELLADLTAYALRAIASKPELSGIYHVTNSGETSWFGYAQFIFELLRLKIPDVELARLTSVSTADYAQKARRPLNSRLSTRKFQTAFDIVLPSWQQSVTRTLNETF